MQTFAYVTFGNGGSAEGTNGNVLVIDTAATAVVTTVKVDANPSGLVATPNGKRVYVAGHDTGVVSVIDTVTNAVVKKIPLGKLPFSAAVTPDGKRVYITLVGSKSVAVIDTTVDQVVTTVPLAATPLGIAITPDGKHAYVPCETPDTVSIIDTVSNAVVGAVALENPGWVVISPDGKRAYVTSGGSQGSAVSVIDTQKNNLLNEIFLGLIPKAFCRDSIGDSQFDRDLIPLARGDSRHAEDGYDQDGLFGF